MITNKKVTLFTDSTPKGMKMKNMTSKTKVKNIHVKLFPSTESALKMTLEKQGYNSDAIIAVSTLSTIIMEIRKICQNCNISKILFTSILPSSKIKTGIQCITEKVKDFCFRNNFKFINHQGVTRNDLWFDEIQLTNGSKVQLKCFVNDVNFLGHNTCFLGVLFGIF